MNSTKDKEENKHVSDEANFKTVPLNILSLRQGVCIEQQNLTL